MGDCLACRSHFDITCVSPAAIMPRPIQATIHVSALRHNLNRIRSAAPGAKVFAVVKANAYGHGIERVYAGLNGADGFALLDLSEAERLRALGWIGPILLLEGVFEAQDLDVCSRLNLWHVVHRAEQIDWLAAHAAAKPHHVFLKMNAGMNRLGFRPDEFRAVYTRLKALPQVGGITLMMHFSDADRDHGIDAPWATFAHAIAGLDAPRCVCNSAALLRYGKRPELRGDWVRAGIALYGGSPDYPAHDIRHWGLEPTMSLNAQLIAAYEIGAGESVGYGSTFTADRALRIGIAACGYADGYPRQAATATPILVDGIRTRTLGRVSMDMLAIDLSPIPRARMGSEVTLWGRSSAGAVLPIDDVADAAGTIGYELMCAITARVPIRPDPAPVIA
jgi:alanine racemase